MSKVRVNLSDESNDSKGYLEFEKLSVKQSKNFQKDLAASNGKSEMLELKLNKYRKFYEEATDLDQASKLEKEILEIVKEQNAVTAENINRNIKAIADLLIGGQIDNQAVTKDNLEDLVTVTAISKITDALTGGLVESHS